MKQLLSIGLLILLGACQQESPKKIFYINSYHEGYKSSDDIKSGIDGVLKGEDVQLETYYMDTKRLTGEQLQASVRSTLQRLTRFQPDLVIASDDNAVKYIVEPHLKEGDVPVLFCGVNWSSEKYGLPVEHITGMLEILPVAPSLDTLVQYFPGIQKVGVLSENTNSERSNEPILTAIFEQKGFECTYRLVDNYDAWRDQFLALSAEVDVIFIPTNGGVKGWDAAGARSFVQEHIQVPVFTCDDFMMEYSVFGLTKVAKEQGQWVAQKALDVLSGQDIATVGLTYNQEYESWINARLSSELGVDYSEALLSEARVQD